MNVVVNFGHIDRMSEGTMTDAKILITHALRKDLEKWTLLSFMENSYLFVLPPTGKSTHRYLALKALQFCETSLILF